MTANGLAAPGENGTHPPAAASGSIGLVATELPIRGSAAALVRHMETSLSVPTATTMRTFSVAALDEARRRLVEEGRPLSSSRLIAYAVVRAAATVPGVTHRFQGGPDGPRRIVDGAVHLGVAVDVPRPDGTRQVIVPVIERADRHDLAGFIAAYDEIIAAARTGMLSPAQLQGANLILTNTGAFGSTTGVPRLPVGPGAIIAVGTIGFPPGLERIGAELGIDRICTASSTYDHRVIQGADSGLFLKEFAALLSDPASDLWAELLPSPPVPPAPSALPAAHAEPRLSADAAAQSDGEASPAAVADALRELHRLRREGYRDAWLDPLEPAPAAAIDADEAARRWRGVTTTDVGVDGPVRAFAKVYPQLAAAWCGTMSPDVWHLRDAQERAWWAARVEVPPTPPSADAQVTTLRRLVAIDTLERFMQRVYRGHKTLSVQGLDATVLMSQVLVDLAAERGVPRVNIGMAHRGRVNLLAHVTGMPYDRLFSEFEKSAREDAMIPAGANGDVKQHLGWESDIEVLPGRMVTVALLPNPSHLEFVSPVAIGATRAHQDRRRPHEPDAGAGLAVLMHGDAAFTGQGVVAETFNMQGLAGFTVGGAIHIVQDNQLGFTTERQNLRSTQWPSDIARGYDVPIVHVNADDPEACVRAARLAFDFRGEFGRDVVLHVVGYRRLGHTETDEPTFTQSQLYERIAAHPPVVDVYHRRLQHEGVVTAGFAEDLVTELERDLRAAQAVATAASAPVEEIVDDVVGPTRVPEIPEEELVGLAQALTEVPVGTTPHTKVARVLERRRELLERDGLIDWAHAELLAFARVARSGRPVRLSGQDVVRGTFTQRHLTIHDAAGTRDHSPLFSLPELGGLARAWHSPLSEAAVLAFEYGYSLDRPDALVLWEAQFGDFANGGQVITDQFISGGFTKWGRRSRLTMLLPHGYDGAGPEHSSARMERYLQLSAQHNLTVAVPTTPAQYHALLMQQALMERPRPLAVFTPKSLLRHKSVVSSVGELAAARFEPVLATDLAEDRSAVRRVLLCQGKVYYELVDAALELGRDDLAILRLEQLYPFPDAEVRAALAAYSGAAEIAWVQEEPRNMGAAQHVLENLREVPDLRTAVAYVGRPARAATAEGYGSTHRRVQADLVRAAVAGDPPEAGAGDPA